MTNIKRLSLLPDAEITDLYARPDFNTNERELYFTMDQTELDITNCYSSTKTRTFFILQLAYFKAKNQFFVFNFEDVREDVKYILVKFFKTSDLVLAGSISRKYIGLQRQSILKLFDYKDWSADQVGVTEAHLCELLRYYPKNHDALRQLFVYFANQKIVALPEFRWYDKI